MMEMVSLLACPQCRGVLAREDAAYSCGNCARRYLVSDEVPQFDPPTVGANPGPDERVVGGDRDQRRSYWDQGWQARLQSDHAFLRELKTRTDWESYLRSEILRLEAYRHVSVVEARREVIRGKVVLDIGCGAGITGPLLGYHGAHYLGVDHSSHAAMHTLRHLRGVGAEGLTAQGNAESLPIRDAAIDVVYSNGVLHHTPNFLTAMNEAIRVLKPGGRAIIALYSTWSTAFGLVRVLGALRGNLTPRAMDRWMGAASEGAWRTGTRLNPWTQTFSKAQLRRVVGRYRVSGLTIRKSGNPVEDLPWLGRRIIGIGAARALDRALEPALGGMLVMSFNKD